MADTLYYPFFLHGAFTKNKDTLLYNCAAIITVTKLTSL